MTIALTFDNVHLDLAPFLFAKHGIFDRIQPNLLYTMNIALILENVQLDLVPFFSWQDVEYIIKYNTIYYTL